MIGQKIPLAQSLNRFAEKKIADAMQLLGKNLPAVVETVDGSIVTVSFQIQSGFVLPMVTVPVASSEYVRLPIQPGCKGVVMAMDARINNMSGLGPASNPDLSDPANITALIFVPIGNTDFFSVPGDQAVVYGPNGAILANATMSCKIDLTTDGIVITLPASATMQVMGGTVLVPNGDVVAGAVSLLNHVHPVDNIQTGMTNIDTGAPL